MEFFMPVKDLLVRFWNFFLNFLAAIIVFVIGWLVAKLIKSILVRVLKAIRLDSVAEKVKVAEFLSKGGIKYTLSEILGLIVYWVIILGVLISSLDILALTGVSAFLDKIVGYIPNVIGALIILILGMFISVFVASIIRTAAANLGLNQANLLSKVGQVAILVFAIIITLDQLQIGAVLVSAMNIVLASIGLAVALAFGMGCRDLAGRFVSDIIDKLKKK
ncbi:MAG: hypothetical protein DRP74_07135 [Candidatus Omnitrophota bacterium]|nr:MAG: hypothetical protein DRP74_07135 [Candidatus Omnitrophota bacterium]